MRLDGLLTLSFASSLVNADLARPEMQDRMQRSLVDAETSDYIKGLMAKYYVPGISVAVVEIKPESDPVIEKMVFRNPFSLLTELVLSLLGIRIFKSARYTRNSRHIVFRGQHDQGIHCRGGC